LVLFHEGLQSAFSYNRTNPVYVPTINLHKIYSNL
jgi:hypothetical protein